MLVQIEMLAGGVALLEFVGDDFSEWFEERWPDDDISDLEPEARAFIEEERHGRSS